MTDPLVAMKERFELRCREDLGVLQRGDMTQLGPMFHRLAGTAGLFGHEQLGVLALELDQHGADGRELPPVALARLERGLEMIVAGLGPGSTID